MRLLLIDHGRCDPAASRAHRVRAELGRDGTAVAVCGPSSVPRLEDTDAATFGIHLHDIAAASHRFLDAVRDGSPAALLAAIPSLSPRLLGSVRETARQLIAEAVDATDPDAVFVMHAGILADLAVETGVPVAVHVGPADLEAAAASRGMRKLVARALGSSEVLVAADEAVTGRLRAGWVEADAAAIVESWPLDDACASRIAAACRLAIERRRGV
jgi:hypothetical protein